MEIINPESNDLPVHLQTIKFDLPPTVTIVNTVYEVRDNTNDELYHSCGYYSSQELAEEAIAKGETGYYSPEDYDGVMYMAIYKHEIDNHSIGGEKVFQIRIGELLEDE